MIKGESESFTFKSKDVGSVPRIVDGKGGRLQKFNDKVLVPWWSRYLVLPGLAAAPGTFAVFWFGEHTADQQFWLKGKGRQ